MSAERVERIPAVTGAGETVGRLRLSRPTRAFIRHYGEMVAAMLAGMAVYGGLLTLAGVEVAEMSAEVRLLAMAFAMTVPMVAWMRYRGHGWTPAWEMSGVMIAPAMAAIGLLWAGLVEDIGALLAIEHTVMFAAMLAVMLARREEYIH